MESNSIKPEDPEIRREFDQFCQGYLLPPLRSYAHALASLTDFAPGTPSEVYYGAVAPAIHVRPYGGVIWLNKNASIAGLRPRHPVDVHIVLLVSDRCVCYGRTHDAQGRYSYDDKFAEYNPLHAAQMAYEIFRMFDLCSREDMARIGAPAAFVQNDPKP